MNLLFFLTPKANCAHLFDDYTLRQAIERMENSGYTALPILRRDGSYCGTLTEGDLLWAVKNLCLMDMRDVREEIARKGDGFGEGSVNEAYLTGKYDGAAEGQAKAEKEKQEALAKQQRMLENKYKAMLVQKYQQGLEAARAADAPELKKAVLNDVPGWVRWLVKPYLKSNEEQE